MWPQEMHAYPAAAAAAARAPSGRSPLSAPQPNCPQMAFQLVAAKNRGWTARRSLRDTVLQRATWRDVKLRAVAAEQAVGVAVALTAAQQERLATAAAASAAPAATALGLIVPSDSPAALERELETSCAGLAEACVSLLFDEEADSPLEEEEEEEQAMDAPPRRCNSVCAGDDEPGRKRAAPGGMPVAKRVCPSPALGCAYDVTTTGFAFDLSSFQLQACTA